MDPCHPRDPWLKAPSSSLALSPNFPSGWYKYVRCRDRQTLPAPSPTRSVGIFPSTGRAVEKRRCLITADLASPDRQGRKLGKRKRAITTHSKAGRERARALRPGKMRIAGKLAPPQGRLALLPPLATGILDPHTGFAVGGNVLRPSAPDRFRIGAGL